MATPVIQVLETQLNVDVDSMDRNVAKSLPFVPHNMISNQLLEYGDKGWEVVLDRISAQLCAANIANLQGRVLQTSPFHAYDTQKVVDHGSRYAVELEKVGISKDRFCIKISATGPAINAGRRLSLPARPAASTSLTKKM
ncbi:hypothetical protein DFH09DRAFT_1470539 [Mycena vulgaris]|nr:hypothetical protein DFH09DRAFT_1470539 [Mycena vulgaris]